MSKVLMPLKSTIICLIGLAIFYAISFNYFDQPIAYYFHDQILKNSLIFQLSTYLDNALQPYSWGMIMVLIFIYCGVLYLRKKPIIRIIPWLISALSLLVALILGLALKYTLARYRPEMLFNYDLYGFHFFSMKNAYNSTPSGHALANFSGLLSLAYITHKRSLIICAILLATLICFTRLLVSKHFLSDVVFGSYIGIFSFLWVRWFILSRITKISAKS